MCRKAMQLQVKLNLHHSEMVVEPLPDSMLSVEPLRITFSEIWMKMQVFLDVFENAGCILQSFCLGLNIINPWHAGTKLSQFN